MRSIFSILLFQAFSQTQLPLPTILKPKGTIPPVPSSAVTYLATIIPPLATSTNPGASTVKSTIPAVPVKPVATTKPGVTIATASAGVTTKLPGMTTKKPAVGAVKPTVAPKSAVLGLLRQVPSEIDASRGYFDPHSHLRGIPHFLSYALSNKAVRGDVDTFLNSSTWKTFMANQVRPLVGFTEVYAPYDYLYLYQYFVEHQIGLVDLRPLSLFSDNPIFPQLENLKGLVLRGVVQNLIQWQIVSGDLARMTKGTGMLPHLLQCLKDAYESGASTSQLELLLSRIFNASPYLDFDAAYVVRGHMEDPFTAQPSPDAEGYQRQLRMTVQTLIDDGVTYVEISNPYSSIPVATTTYCGKPTSLRNSILYQFMVQDPYLRGKVTIRWLPMFLGTLLSLSDDELSVSYQGATECHWSREGDPGLANQNLCAKEFLAFPWVNGVDYAGVESNCFTAKSKTVLQAHVQLVYNAAVKKGRKMVVHVHAGEGSGLLDINGTFGEVALTSNNYTQAITPDKLIDTCEAMQAADAGHGVPFQRTANGVPVHYGTASHNLDVLLSSFQQVLHDLTPQLVNGSRYLSLRIGHATHATNSHAQMMQAMSIAVDVNLMSNLATRSQLWSDDHYKEASFAHTHDILSSDLLPPWQLEWVFQDHAFIRLLGAGVPLTLGTDGQGVESSEMRSTYMIAQGLVSFYRDNCCTFPSTTPSAIKTTTSANKPTTPGAIKTTAPSAPANGLTVCTGITPAQCANFDMARIYNAQYLYGAATF